MENSKINQKEKGVTLVALVITIIILIILAIITINVAIKLNIIDLATKSSEDYQQAQYEEEEEFNKLNEKINKEILQENTGTVSKSDYDKLASLVSTLSKKVENLENNQKSAANPTGTIIAYSVNNVPNGYLKCEGQEVSRTDYKDLFDIIGTTYGGRKWKYNF